MNEGFIVRSLRTFGIVLLIFLPFGVYYFGIWRAVAILSGGVWGMVNILFLSALVRAAVRPDGMQKEKTAVWALLKFPIMYASAFALLKVPQFEALWLLAGFTGIMLVMVLKAVARVVLEMDQPGSNRMQGAI